MKIKVWTQERGIRTLKDANLFDQYKEKYPSARKVRVPSMNTMEKWVSDGVAKAIDGCRVEPDGICEHGFPSFLLALDWI